MNPEITKLIEQYLSNEMSSADKYEFENRIFEDPSLQKEVEIQKKIHDAAKRAARRAQIQQIAKSYHFNKNTLTAGIVIAILLATSFISYFIYTSANKAKEFSESPEVKALIEKLEEKSPIDNLASEFFYWEGKDSVMLSKEGVLVSVPKNAFLLDGLPFKQKVIIQWQEAMDGATIVKSGLSTMAGDRMLETQGMFGLQAYTKDGRKLTVNPKVGIYIQAPVDEYKKDMQLFTGVKGKNGIIDWARPKPLQKIPVAVDMKELDFYPEGYENKLNELKRSSEKKYRDSLYLSFENEEVFYVPDTTVPAPEPSKASKETKKSIDEPFSTKEYKNINRTPTPEISSDKIQWNETFLYTKNHKGIVIITADLQSNCNLTVLDNLNPKSIFNTKINIVNSSSFKVTKEVFSYNNTPIYNSIIKSDVYKENSLQFIFEIEILNDTFFEINIIKNFTVCKKGQNLPSSISESPIYISGFAKNFKTDKTTPEPSKSNQHISPAKVMAFWQPAFNKTILSTREFENRMKAIHKTCDNKVLDLYTKNLSSTMNEIDEMAVKSGHPEFNDFVNEHVGAMNPNNPHLKNLQKFYDKEIKKLKRIVEVNSSFKKRKENSWDNEVQKGRKKEENRTEKREEKALIEEYDLNMKNVCKQLGRTVGFQIHGGGTVYNIDKYVMDATVSRKSALITDPETGKTAKITYNPFSCEVKNSDQYDKLFTYLFPTQLNSYQRISGENGKFNYPLNNDIQYDLCVVGISDKGYFYKEVRGINKGNLGAIDLSEIKEKDLDNKIHLLNENRGILRPMSISSEITWLKTEQKNYIEVKKRKEDFEFRVQIKKVIFPCWNGAGEYLPASQADISKI